MENNVIETPGSIKTDIYTQVTNIIIQQLENGVIPWQKPWTSSDQRLLEMPVNFVTGNRYRGINIVLLWSSSLHYNYQTDEWASFKQWQSKNEAIRKGEKGSLIVYYDRFAKEVDGEVKDIPFLKKSYVFNRCQLESYTAPETIEPRKQDLPVEELSNIQQFVLNTRADIQWHDDRACYIPSLDVIKMPAPELFISTEAGTATESYYSVLMHELTHWTGHEKRLNRTYGRRFGDKDYATEELLAEFGAAFLCAGFGIPTADKGNHAGYIDHWLKVLKENQRCLFTAASEASKAVDYLYEMQVLSRAPRLN